VRNKNELVNKEAGIRMKKKSVEKGKWRERKITAMNERINKK
jgi:hypothetical protein